MSIEFLFSFQTVIYQLTVRLSIAVREFAVCPDQQRKTVLSRSLSQANCYR